MSDVVVNIDELKSLVIKKLTDVDVNGDDAKIVADVLVHADARGVRSHGTIRIEHYVNRIKSGGINLRADLKITDTARSTAIVDSQGGFGHTAMHFAMSEAIKRLQHDGGIFAILVENSSHCGALSYYVDMALEHKLISMVMVNTDKCVVPFGAASDYFGTNPMAFGFPGNEHRILADMSTSQVALGRIFTAREDEETIPTTWGVDKNGVPTDDPFEVKYVSPLGGYKGTALAMAVEGFTGFFNGAFGPYLSLMYGDLDKCRNLSGMVFLMDSNTFGKKDTYLKSVDKMFDDIKELKPAVGFEEAFVPGEIGDNNYNKSLEEGVHVYANVYNFLKN